MSSTLQDGYGWRTVQAPHSCAYLGPKILELQVARKRPCDLNKRGT